MRQQQTKPVEVRYNRAVSKMRSLHVSLDTKEIQKDIEWTRHQIETYGFQFFPNLYVFDLVKDFEQKVEQLANHKSTKMGR